MSHVRLYINHPLGSEQAVPVGPDQAHYLSGVMRLKPGATIEVFNGREGAWSARILNISKRGGELVVIAQLSPQRNPPDVWLIFAPIKKARTDFIVEKASELGAARILPVQTEFTNTERVRQDRLQAHAVEAAEQCGGNYVPEVADFITLPKLLDSWDSSRRILWADETRTGLSDMFAGLLPGKWAILIGPEGGFSSAEALRLRKTEFVIPISLGPRILRADTAAVAALTLFQSHLGDW